MNKYIFSFCFFLIYFVTETYCQQNEKRDSIKYFNEDYSKYTLKPININSSSSDFSPIIINNNLIFVSGREYQYGVVYSNIDKDQLMDLYECEMIDSITFKTPVPFSRTINTNYNDGPACVNDKNNLIVYSSNTNKKPDKKNKSNKNNLQLFLSKKKSNEWSEPVCIKFCKSKFSYCHPYFSSDQKTLFFSSNMPGGFGEMDLYYSVYENNIWSTPVNLGSKINTKANEVFPFVSTNNILYFSYKDSLGFGGLDIYSFDLNDSLNTKKQLLEKPINSSYDDFGVFIDSTGKRGYLSSNRINENKDDIFYFSFKYPYFNNCSPFVKTSNCFTFFEESTLQGDDNGLEYEWSLGDGTKIKGLEAKHCFSKPGSYIIELNVIDKATDSVFYNQASYEFTVEDSEQLNISCPDTIALNTPVLIYSFKSKITNYSIDKYFWNFGDDLYSSGIAGYHKYSNKGEYYLSLGVLAKNDSTGNYKNFCVEKKVIVDDNFSENYKIVGNNDIASIYESVKKIENKRISNDTLLQNQNNHKNILKDILGKKPEYEELQRIITFDSEKYLVNQKYFSTLDSISKILKKEDSMFKLAIYSNTDTTANRNNSLELSVKRANAIKRYIVNKGAITSFIKINPLGEQIPFLEGDKRSELDFNNKVIIYLLKKK